MRAASFSLVICVLAMGFAGGTARAEDEFMKECRVTSSQKMCDCIVSKMPADKRAAAVIGMRKSNAALQPGGSTFDPSTLTPEQMAGLDAVVIAQASCM